MDTDAVSWMLTSSSELKQHDHEPLDIQGDDPADEEMIIPTQHANTCQGVQVVSRVTFGMLRISHLHEIIGQSHTSSVIVYMEKEIK